MTIVWGPQDLEVTEGDTATMECKLSQALADVTWEKVRAAALAQSTPAS